MADVFDWRKAREVLDNVRGNINPERGYADELEADVVQAIAAIDAATSGVMEVDPSSLEQRLREWADSLPAGTLGAVHMGTLMSVARRPFGRELTGDRAVMQRALDTFTAILGDMEGIGSRTQLDDDLLPEVQSRQRELWDALGVTGKENDDV